MPYARDALLVYRLFLADKSVPDAAKSLVQKQMTGSRMPPPRTSCDWVPSGRHATRHAAHDQAELLVKEALDMLSSNNAKLAKQSLEKA